MCRALTPIRVGVEEDGSLELFHGGFHLVRAQMRLEKREIVDGALAMRRRDHECGVHADFVRDFAPCRFDCRDGICQSPILDSYGLCMSDLWEGLAYHFEDSRVSEEGRSSENAAVHSGLKIGGCGSCDADDRFHGGVAGKIS